MPFKFPYTNFQELNLDWIIKKVKDLSKQIEDDSSIVSEYIDRLIAVEDKADNAEATANSADARATGANNTANSAITLATQAKQTADIADLQTTLLDLKIGNLSSLYTTAKDTIVNAINEVWSIFHNATAVTNVTPAGTDPAVTYSNGVFTFDLPEGGDPDAVTHAELDAAVDALEDSIDDLSEELDNKADVIIDTVSGDPATFPDGTATPLLSLVVNVEPIQNLNGQDAPYLPGGGKNKLPNTASSELKNGVQFTVQEDGSIKVENTASANTAFVVGSVELSAGTYILNGITGGIDNDFYIQLVNEEQTTQIAFSYNGDKQFTLSETQVVVFRIFIRNGVNTNGKIIYPMIRLSSVADATFAPYSNICPISGRTSCIVNVNSETYPVNFGETVWNAEHDIISGEGKNKEIVLTLNTADMNNSEAYPGWKMNLTGIAESGFNDIVRKPTSISNSYGMNTLSIANSIIFFIPSILPFNQTQLKALAIDVQVRVSLATPTDITTTPTIITASEGANTVQSDAGSVDVTYRADTKGYIDKLIAQVQALALGG